MNSAKTQRLTVSSLMLALATALALVCEGIPFLNLRFGGGYTVASMLPIVIVSYMYGIKWGFFTSGIYALIQVFISLSRGAGGTVMALFLPGDSNMGVLVGILVIVIDYLLAYGIIGIGGIFRNRIKSKTAALLLGVIVALSLRYCCHILSGFLFYGEWAEWFFSQEGFYSVGAWVLDTFRGKGLAFVYSVFYNGLFMVPEIVITALLSIPVSRIPNIRKTEV